MNKTMKNSLLAAITLGLMSGSAIAESELAGQATNPIANLVQLQIQDYYVADSYNAGGDSNLFIVQPVIPIKLSSEAVPSVSDKDNPGVCQHPRY